MTDNHFVGLGLRVPGEDRLEEIYTLRHRAYLAERAITPRPSGMFVDRYDLLRTSTNIAVEDAKGLIVGAIRFAVQPPSSHGIHEFISTPEFLVFPDVLEDLLVQGGAIASGARFSVEPGHPQRCQIALMLVLAQAEAAKAVEAKWGIATARGGHLNFYRRFLHMEPICEARPMPGLEYSYCLLASDVEHAYGPSRKRFPDACRAQLTATAPDFHAQIRAAMPRILQEQAA